MKMNAFPHILATATLTVDMDMIRDYADLSDDYNPIHLDPEFAAGTPMGGVIAHGTMSISLIWQSLHRTFGNSAFAGIDLDIRFVKPVRVGEVLTAGGELVTGAGDTPLYQVWVRGLDGVDRLAGHVRLPAGATSSTAAN